MDPKPISPLEEGTDPSNAPDQAPSGVKPKPKPKLKVTVIGPSPPPQDTTCGNDGGKLAPAAE